MSLRDAAPYSLRQLQYVVAVAELGGFRRAADACGVAQPSMSAQIARVERSLGVQLFERGPRGVRVTTAGAPVIDRARAVLLAARDFADTARQHSDPRHATLRIGVIPTVCPYLLPDVTPALHRALPDLQIVWSEDKTRALLHEVAEGGLDAAIVALDTGTAGLEHQSIGDDAFVLAAAPGHPLVRDRGPISPARLAGATVLLLEDGHCFRDQALALCGTAGAEEADLRATGLSTLVQMVGAGAGVTLLPAMAVPVENRRGQLAIRPFKKPAPKRRLVLGWRKGAALRGPLVAVARVLRESWPTQARR